MRSIIISITCDGCQNEIEEEVEGGSSVIFTARGEEREFDLCDGCLGMSFWTDARPVANRRKRKAESETRTRTPKKTRGEFVCECGRSFGTQRGLAHHQTSTHG